MTNLSDIYPRQNLNPAELLAETVATRQAELNYLINELRYGIEFISDLDRVNTVILASTRPDLTLTEPAPMFQIAGPNEFGRLNNFNANMENFGGRILSEPTETSPGVIRQKTIGRRPFTDEEKAIVFFISARGGYDDHLAFAEAHGIDRDFARDVLMSTPVGDESFMRMWILFPGLTDFILKNSLVENWQAGGRKDTREEIFVAYSLMSRLVNMNDDGIRKDDGTVDGWHLCR